MSPQTTETITPVQAPETVDTDGGDHDRFAHYCKKADITRALVTGEAIVALCGKKCETELGGVLSGWVHCMICKDMAVNGVRNS